MEPQLVARLTQNVPELRDFIGFLASEAEKLNTITDIDNDIDIDAIEIEIIARKRAYATITRILEPLLSVDKQPSGTRGEDYVV